MAKAAMLMSFIVLAVFSAMPAQSLMPYRSPSLFDMMFPSVSDDPFRILEESPLAIQKAVEAVALARADWKETKTEHVITLDIPGMTKDEVKIEVDQEIRALKISGERRKEEEVEGETWHRAERTVGKFWRQFRLPASVDWDKIQAQLDNGVLKIVVPKMVEEKKKEPRVINIDEAAERSGNAGNVDVKGSKDEI